MVYCEMEVFTDHSVSDIFLVFCDMFHICCLRFLPPPVNNGIRPNILLNLDLSASYLFVTDSTKMVNQCFINN